MLSRQSSVAVRVLGDHPQTGVNDAIRTLVQLIKLSGIAPALNNQCVLSDSAEEVLFDTEVDGCRYLLVRMPKLSRRRIQLSPREVEIVRMVAKGHPNKVIADVLSISSWTVCTHLRRIFAKLGVGSRAAMVAQLLEMGALGSEHRGSTDSM
jgi:DNA-binding CsgD family transcriptional regulator